MYFSLLLKNKNIGSYSVFLFFDTADRIQIVSFCFACVKQIKSNYRLEEK